MRKNLPVTQIEYEMLDGQPIVSKTDLKGKITYINPYFVEVSGFTEEELIGAPHNLVRHPDMPQEAFADLWQSLKAGVPWTGMVKNRRKNGDFYWVVANVTPVLEGGRVTGYMSIRSKPSRAQIEAADRLYRAIAAGNPERMTICQGQAVPAGWRGWLRKLAQPSITARLGTGLGVMALLLAAMAGIGFGDVRGVAAGWFAAVSALAILNVAVLGYFLHAHLLRPLREATRAARGIAGGDLTGVVDTTRGDDMGQLLRALQQINVNMVAIIGDVRSNVDSMTTATREIAAGNLNLSARTEAQASSLEETASSMELLSSTVRQNAAHAQSASELAAATSAAVAKGGDSVVKVGATMEEISRSSQKIVDIIGLIDGIAFQTNILALNAAVEAARAGEQGRGFAVVASEVRSLAQRSAGAAKEIKVLIDDSVSKVELGNKLTADAGRTMTEIIQSVERVTTIMNEIALASREQSSGIEQVNLAVTQMDEGTQQNAALVEQAAAAAASLDEQAKQLALAVSVFHVARRAGGSAPVTRMQRRPAGVAAARRPAGGAKLRLAGAGRRSA